MKLFIIILSFSSVSLADPPVLSQTAKDFICSMDINQFPASDQTGVAAAKHLAGCAGY